jgi:hypothetical protein
VTSPEHNPLPICHEAVFPPAMNVVCCMASISDAPAPRHKSAANLVEVAPDPRRHEEEDPERWDGMA